MAEGITTNAFVMRNRTTLERKQGNLGAIQVLNWANRDGDPLASKLSQRCSSHPVLFHDVPHTHVVFCSQCSEVEFRKVEEKTDFNLLFGQSSHPTFSCFDFPFEKKLMIQVHARNPSRSNLSYLSFPHSKLPTLQWILWCRTVHLVALWEVPHTCWDGVWFCERYL